MWSPTLVLFRGTGRALAMPVASSPTCRNYDRVVWTRIALALDNTLVSQSRRREQEAIASQTLSREEQTYTVPCMRQRFLLLV